jgi:hypothetical protein
MVEFGIPVTTTNVPGWPVEAHLAVGLRTLTVVGQVGFQGDHSPGASSRNKQKSQLPWPGSNAEFLSARSLSRGSWLFSESRDLSLRSGGTGRIREVSGFHAVYVLFG